MPCFLFLAPLATEFVVEIFFLCDFWIFHFLVQMNFMEWCKFIVIDFSYFVVNVILIAAWRYIVYRACAHCSWGFELMVVNYCVLRCHFVNVFFEEILCISSPSLFHPVYSPVVGSSLDTVDTLFYCFLVH